ncbi:hypothetical protein pdam_00021883, partial [Pocillopora damicornis]
FCDLIVDRDAFITVSFILRATSAIGGAAAETSAMSILLGKYPDNIGMVSWLYKLPGKRYHSAPERDLS